ncbi:2-oxoglutarate dehydrogenase complex dihydrolipoyllysine-residue succinyltransferase [Sphingomicrobium astaxanthinifaciens]|uniref:2-oxoglutarate dehydrogenase complex dihydrolipoyllysine-residue succinyltransferase n=1 Tax=Sphingomicrobium astaxanthinifaciens TaxID=1227949 RepID=UPI001FCB8160|nr:2-oxoglutarate dehydrogenase complex dihydrolipoyllysine-residue succinyltransferase [Sphingomicrobium astaxanthinifaciens]MCJ7421674.1 2-oxoglutarate dehydrogenase complex dihydrolipoyllysine-residue succinyltransferase [Sphingomicrobium astaxanthinifaciens]
MATDVTVPTLGESITEATVGEWLKQPGDPVEQDEPIVSLETDKVSVDVPSPVAGVLEEHLFGAGDTVEVGQVIAKVGEGSGVVADQPKPARKEQAPGEGPDGAQENNDVVAQGEADEPALSSDLTLSPAVRRAVLEHGVDPSKITGTGKDGRITKDDVIAAAKAKDSEPAAKAAAASGGQASAPTNVTVSGERREERVKMSRLRQTIAKRLKDAQNSAALLTTFNDVDMSAVMDARNRYKELFAKKHGIRLGFMSFFVKAVALAAKDVPAVNARIEGDEIVYHDYLDVSVAVSAPKGLVVPVIRSADRMSFAQIEQAIADYGKRAKEGTLGMEDMAGGTFTISNGGVFGSLLSTPIINPPQSAVLGMHRIEERPVAVNGEVVIKPMMYLALSYDHRLIDGREAVTFLVRIKEALEDPTRLLIDL